jgi:nucleoside-diphosphate-sugar epimerase
VRILITGGTGFIGSRLALRYLADGKSVRVLALENNPVEAANAQRLREHGAEILIGSVTELNQVATAAVGVDVVFHLAATQHEMNVPDQRFQAVNVEGTRNVLEASITAGVRRVVHGSTIGVYSRLDGVIDESSPTEPDNIYGVTKLQGERVALSYADQLPVVVIRIPEVYGPGDRRLLKLFRAIDRGAFFMIGAGRNVHHPIYVEDLVDGLRSAADAPDAPGQIILLAGKESVITAQMATAIAAALGRRPPSLRVPLFVFAAAATVLELTLRPLGIQPPIHRRRLDFFRKSFTLSAAKAERLLAFDPRVGFPEGARRTAAWYREIGELPPAKETTPT